MILSGFLKAATTVCGSCGKDEELRFGTCFDCADHVKAKHIGDGLFQSRDTRTGKTYLAKMHGSPKQASKRNALPKCVKCGGPGGQYPTAVCKKCGYDGKPQERRRSKTAGLARRFRLNLATQKAVEKGVATPALHAANELASMKVQRRATLQMGKGLDHYINYSESRGVLHDARRQAGLRSRVLQHAGLGEFPGHIGIKHAAFWSPHHSFPYRGDMKVIALNPESGMTSGTRQKLLDEHYRRMSAETRPNMGEAAVIGALGGAAFGGAVTGLRVAGALRASGNSLSQALHGAVRPALAGAAVGGALGIPIGVYKGYMRNREISRAQGYTGSDLSTRRNMLRAEVNHALGVS